MSSSVVSVSADVEFHLLLKHILEREEFVVVLAQDGSEALDGTGSDRPVAVVIDCRRGGVSGHDICSQIKADPETRSVVVVAVIENGAENLYFEMMKAGVDRCFHRPFEPVKLIEYLLSVSSVDKPGDRRALLRGAGIELDPAARRVRRDGETVHLGAIEFNLLKLLMENPGQALSREQLIASAWPENTYVDDRTVDVHIGVLRKALKQNDGTNLILTLRGIGYSIDL